MQLKKIYDGLKPVTLAVGIIASSNILYSEVDVYSGITSSSSMISNYVKNTDLNDSVTLFSKYKFELHLQKWNEKTMFLSSTSAIVNDVDFKEIVSMGKTAVPYIKDEISHNPSALVWALNYIFKQKISNDKNITISEACRLWVEKLS